jgi:hypothetical protein
MCNFCILPTSAKWCVLIHPASASFILEKAFTVLCPNVFAFIQSVAVRFERFAGVGISFGNNELSAFLQVPNSSNLHFGISLHAQHTPFGTIPSLICSQPLLLPLLPLLPL